jgi:transcriptional regulator of arginine metabolism
MQHIFMQKSKRLEAITNIVSSVPIARQDELIKSLSKKGYKVTQASVSRDLDELGIAKVGGRYALPSKPINGSAGPAVTLLLAGDNLIIGRCPPGMASAVAVGIDALDLPQIIGTIAGDDTIFIAVKDAASQKTVLKKILELY